MREEKHRWRFFRAGGVDQLAITSGKDIANLKSLDQKLWVALAMPTRGVALDEKTLKLLDTDQDGRVRVPEVLAAIEWLEARLDSLDILLQPGDTLPLSAIRNEELRATAGRVLDDAKREGELGLDQVVEVVRRYAERPFNGDGIVVEIAAPDDETRGALKDILATVGGEKDRSGKDGVSRASMKAFFEQAAAHLEWAAEAQRSPELLPLGPDTPAAAAALRVVQEKIDDFFMRCRMTAFDERAVTALLPTQAELTALSAKLLSAASADLRAMPLARIAPGRNLPLRDGVNPAWAKELEELAAKAVKPVLGEAARELDEAAFATIRTKLQPFEAWQARKPVSPVSTLPDERLQALCGGGVREKLEQLVSDDLERAGEMDQLGALEKLMYLRRDLCTLLQNFTSFSRFYGRAPEGALFQAGTLYIDGRALRLCLEVADVAKHGLLASMASTYLLYCDCARADGQKKTIVGCLTAGDSDRVMVGRNGVFYDRQGKDWDATVTKVVAHPISVREAFWTPYKRLARLVEEQVAKRAAAADADSQKQMAVVAETTATADKPKPPPAPAKKMDVGTVAAIGVAVGGIGAMVTGVLAAFFGLGIWMPIGFLAVLLLISGPSMLIAYLKLRRRNLGPILDANGWAINGRARINVPFGRALTDQAVLPPGSERTMRDPFAEKKRPWMLYIFLVLLLALGAAWAMGTLDRYLPGSVKSAKVLNRTEAPPPAPAPPAPPAKK